MALKTPVSLEPNETYGTPSKMRQIYRVQGCHVTTDVYSVIVVQTYRLTETYSKARGTDLQTYTHSIGCKS